MNKDIDSKNTINTHRDIIKRNSVLRNLYRSFYQELLLGERPTGPVVELGAGAGFIKEMYPEVITSDVVPGIGIEKVFFAESMPFKSRSVAAFVMLNVFHHIKDPEKALLEMARCLKPGGKINMIETFNTPWAAFVYTNFHHEDFDTKGTWKIKGKGRLSDSNQALPWIIFVRDKKLFDKKFPTLKVKKISPHTPLLYLFSGGLSKKQPFLFLAPIVVTIERLLAPWNNYLGMFATIEIVKAPVKKSGRRKPAKS
jgi:SAM-dependent methyltransferase